MQIKTGITITEDGRLGLEEFSETSTYTSAPIVRTVPLLLFIFLL